MSRLLDSNTYCSVPVFCPWLWVSKTEGKASNICIEMTLEGPAVSQGHFLPGTRGIEPEQGLETGAALGWGRKIFRKL